jgi:hypothetical protein
MPDTKLDRNLQRDILTSLAETYPARGRDLQGEPFAQHPEFFANMAYLAEHNLVEFRYHTHTLEIYDAGITAEGMDFITEDGGLTAIKRTITVRPDMEGFLALLEKHAESLPEPAKTDFLKAIADFSKPIVQGVVQAALTQWLGLK